MLRAALLAAGLAPATALAETEGSQLQLGLGVLAMVTPDYRGSDYYGPRIFPFPYIVYRTDRVRVSREGVRARLFAWDRLSASFSAGGSLPGNNDNPDRAGMTVIEPTFELGPALDYRIYASADDRFRVRARLPLRGVAAVDGLDVEGVGWVVTPFVSAAYDDRRRGWDGRYIATVGPYFGSEGYHDYYYEVAPRFERLPERPRYDAGPGFGGARLTLSAGLHEERWSLGVFANYDWLDGAVYADSPLVKVDHAVTAGLYITYRGWSSVPTPAPPDNPDRP